MLESHVILVAFDAQGHSREEAELALHRHLIPLLESRDPNSSVESWWVAEDDRRDGSDNNPAVFVPPGRQAEARTILGRHWPKLVAGGPELDALLADEWVVETTYNTDPQGKPVPEEDWSNRTLHGPFPGEEAARQFMEEVWPDGDTDIKEQTRSCLNPPESLTGPLTLPGQLSRGERVELIRRAALHFLHSEDPEGFPLAKLAEALGENPADVEALS